MKNCKQKQKKNRKQKKNVRDNWGKTIYIWIISPCYIILSKGDGVAWGKTHSKFTYISHRQQSIITLKEAHLLCLYVQSLYSLPLFTSHSETRTSRSALCLLGEKTQSRKTHRMHLLMSPQLSHRKTVLMNHINKKRRNIQPRIIRSELDPTGGSPTLAIDYSEQNNKFFIHFWRFQRKPRLATSVNQTISERWLMATVSSGTKPCKSE